MKLKKGLKRLIIFTLVFLILLLLIDVKINNQIKTQDQKIIETYSFNTSIYWNLTGSPIFIDDADPNYNWSKTAADNDWCSGSGTWNDPYIIENVTIDGQGSVSCITIQNSSVYFIIRICTLHRAGWNYDAGIKLINVNNSLLINNTFTRDYFAGILLWKNCINNTIEDNMWYWEDSYCLILYKFCYNNRILNNKMKYSGGNNIYFYENNNDNIIHGNYITRTGDALGAGSSIYFNNDCDKNIISNNNLSHNYYEAIIFNTYCNHNIIKNNRITNNEYSYAILLIQYCNYNNFFNNTIENNGLKSFEDLFGIWFYEECDNNNITQNNIVGNDHYGIYLTIGSGNNTIAGNNIGNTITSNQETGIFIENCDDNIIISNLIFNNSWRGVDIDADSDHNSIFLNYFLNNGIVHARNLGTNNNWNNTEIGNFWDNYTGTDDNQDGIGDLPHDFGTGIDYLPICDDDPPNITIIEPYINQTFSINPPNFKVNIRDAYLDKMWYCIDNSQNITFTNNATIYQPIWNGLIDGIHEINFYANDTFNHFTSKSINIIKDTEEPSINITSPITGSIVNTTTLDFIVRIFDEYLDKMWYIINSGVTKYFFTSNGTIQGWSDLLNGPVTITFYANDTAGNIESDHTTVIKQIQGDTEEPSINIISPITGSIITTTSLNFIVRIFDEHLDKMWYTINLGATKYFFTNNGTIQGWADLPNGPITITFYANDTAGNIESEHTTVIKEVQEEAIPGYNIFVVYLAIFSLIYFIISIKIKNRLRFF